MAKEAYYFSHDSNARQDEKILMLRAEHGWEGYGIYWALIEMMFESSDSALHHNKIKGIAVSYNIDITVLQHVINTCIAEELFTSDNEKFWSESLSRRKLKFHESREKKSEAGKKGMAKRYGKQQSNNTVITEPNKVKESKEKEIKEKESNVLKELADSQFIIFWNLYPNKHGKTNAQKKWNSYYPNLDFERVMNGTQAYIEFCKTTDRPFKDGSTFVNQKSWDEEWTVSEKLPSNIRQFNRGSSGKQQIQIITDGPKSAPLSDEQRERMNEMARQLDDGDSTGTDNRR